MMKRNIGFPYFFVIKISLEKTYHVFSIITHDILTLPVCAITSVFVSGARVLIEWRSSMIANMLEMCVYLKN